MIDTRKREQLEFNISQAFRDFAEGKRKLAEVDAEIVQVAMRREIPSDELINRKNEAAWLIDYARNALDEAKREYTALITAINFYEF